MERLLYSTGDIISLENCEDFKSLHEEHKRLAVLLIRAVQDDDVVGRPCNMRIEWVCDAERPCELYIRKPTDGSGFEILFSVAQSSSEFAAADIIRFSEIGLIIANAKRIQAMTRAVGTLPAALDSYYRKDAPNPKRRRTVESIVDGSGDPSAAGRPPTAEMEMPQHPPQSLSQSPSSAENTTCGWQTVVESAGQLVGQKLQELESAEREAFVRIRAELESNVRIDDVDGMKNAYRRAIILARSEVPGRQELDSVNKAIDAIEHNITIVTKWYERNKPS